MNDNTNVDTANLFNVTENEVAEQLFANREFIRLAQRKDIFFGDHNVSEKLYSMLRSHAVQTMLRKNYNIIITTRGLNVVNFDRFF